jgi:hypothetical protein
MSGIMNSTNTRPDVVKTLVTKKRRSADTASIRNTTVGSETIHQRMIAKFRVTRRNDTDGVTRNIAAESAHTNAAAAPTTRTNTADTSIASARVGMRMGDADTFKKH